MYLPKGRQLLGRVRGMGEVGQWLWHLLAIYLFVSLTTFPTRKRSGFTLMLIDMLDHHGGKGRVEEMVGHCGGLKENDPQRERHY